MIDIMFCRELREISLTVLLVNCHDVTGRIFAPNRYEKSIKNGITNQEKNTGLLHII